VLIEAQNFAAFAGGRKPLPLVLKDGEDFGIPETGEMALRELEARRREGATHFVLPWTSFWWKDSYPEFWKKAFAGGQPVRSGDLLLAFDLRQSK